jgi:3-oxoacyl-[acyl-carrier-protein] synthase II
MSVVVTGVGAVTPLGADVASTLRRLYAGERGVGALSLFELAGARSSRAAEVVGLEQREIAARTDAMAAQAAREALHSAGLATGEGVHLVVGGTTAGMFETEELLTRLGSVDLDADLQHRLKTHPLSSTMDVLHEAHGPFTSARTVCCACTSGVAALALGWSWIRAGRANVVLAGGADALCRLTYGGFGSLSVLSPDDCRPFDARRSGLNLGEGAGFLVLEAEAHARARGARVLGRVASVALGGEAHHITNPEPGGATAAAIMHRALEVAGLRPEDVGYVNAHGTATPHNDAAESAAIRACFGPHRVPVSSSKGQIGHTLGAAGAIEAVITLDAVATGRLPPTAGLETPDPVCDLEHVRVTREVAQPLSALSNSFGFGGTGGSVLLTSRADLPAAPSRSERLVVTGAAAVVQGALLTGAALADLLAEAPLPVPVPPGSAPRASSQTPHSPQQRSTAPLDPTASLDPARARRMDRAGRLSAAVMEAALAVADGGAAEAIDRRHTAAVSGTAFGNVDSSMRFMRRMLEKGAQFASPVDFPNLVPSSPVSHAAIYLGLRGPALATPDLSATAESAFATGLELIEGGVADSAVTGSVEEISELAERVLAPLLGMRSLTAHSEGASAVVVEPRSVASMRGAKVLAQVTFWESRRGKSAVLEVPPPRPGSLVVAEPNVELEPLLASSPWSSAPRRSLATSVGHHVGLGGVALAAAAAFAARQPETSLLVVGAAPGRSYVFLLEGAR